MCGIFALLNQGFSSKNIDEQFQKGRGRGPEHSTLQTVSIGAMFGFHRLAINGLNSESNQPLMIDDIILICNGEIYNYLKLYQDMNVIPDTDSDCEVIIHLYKMYGIEQTLQMLDGVFSFVLLDNRTLTQPHETSKIYVARDPYGVRPLYTIESFDAQRQETSYGFASEVKMLSELRASRDCDTIQHFPPGHYAEYELPQKVMPQWRLVQTTKYHTTGFKTCIMFKNAVEDEIGECIHEIQTYFMSAVFKRCSTTERPIACLLSGGLDSSLVAALVSEYHKINDLPPIETYSIGVSGSEDLHYAKVVAEHLGTRHTEIILTEADFIAAVPEVIRGIESYDTTTVRASIGNWLLGKHISKCSQAKVIFNGDGSDELAGGYLYMGACPDSIEFDRECRRLLKDIHAFDVLRSDKSISSHGLEPRTPFLDRSWVQYYLSILPEVRFHKTGRNPEKYLLRQAFSPAWFSDCAGNPLLPEKVLWRRKEAFSDGVSGKTRSLYEILGDHASTLFPSPETATSTGAKVYDWNPPKTAEQRWYREIFEEAYPGLGRLVPYFWMPKYVNATDASARTLDIYHKDSNDISSDDQEFVEFAEFEDDDAF
jgi:asparagine synthase (glutamine-hydrolysing)